MKAEKTVVLVYTLAGIALGVVSNYVGNIYLALIIPFAVYAVTLPALMKLVQKKKKLATTSFVSFILWWIVAWILLINI